MIQLFNVFFPLSLSFLSLQECGIESLVEELCVKLKKVQEERERNASGSLPGSQSNSPREKPSSSTTTESSDTTPVSQAERWVFVVVN